MDTIYQIGDWLIDPQRNTLTRAGDTREISKPHMRVLVALIESEGEQVSKSALLERAWNSRRASEDNVSVAISHIRKALEDNGKRPKYIHDSSGYYSLLKPVVKTEGKADPVDRTRRFPSKRLLLALLLLLLIIKGFMIRNARVQEEPVEPQYRALALLPLKTGPEMQDRVYQIDAMTEDLIAELSTQNRIAVISSASAMTFKSQDVSPRVIANQLGADAILQGSVAAVGDRVKVNLQLRHVTVDFPDGELIWSKEISGSIDEPLGLQKRILKVIEGNISPLRRRAGTSSAPATVSDADYLSYLRAREMLKTGDRQVIDQAAAILEDLIERVPQFPEPYLDLTVARSLQLRGDPLAYRDTLPALKEKLHQALALDPHLERAYTALGAIAFLYDWDFAEAEKNFLAAAREVPQSRNAHYWLSQFYLAFGQFENALLHLETLKKLDPINYSKAYAAWILNMAGQYEAALQEMKKLAAEQPDTLQLYTAYIKIYENMAREGDAFSYYLQAFKYQGYDAEALADVRNLFQTGKLAGLNYWLAFQKFEQRDVGQYEPPLSLGRYCAAAGEKNLAFDWLTKAWNARQKDLLWINVDPKYDTLRSDPRYEKLVKLMGLDFRPAQQDEP